MLERIDIMEVTLKELAQELYEDYCKFGATGIKVEFYLDNELKTLELTKDIIYKHYKSVQIFYVYDEEKETCIEKTNLLQIEGQVQYVARAGNFVEKGLEDVLAFRFALE